MLVEGLILHPLPIYIVFLRDLIGAKALNSTCTDRSKFGSDLSSEYCISNLMCPKQNS